MANAYCGKLSLERELRAKPKRRRRLNQQCRAPERVHHWRNAGDAAIDREGLVEGHSALTVEDVEPVSGQTQLFTFTNLDWIVQTHIQIKRCRRSVGADAFDNVREPGLA